ncbi:MAG: hypothetical protein K2N78_06040 [Oscillospiraceae bacterium]|nr:hypothetical protein [Oscillospiraceae bacterium]
MGQPVGAAIWRFLVLSVIIWRKSWYPYWKRENYNKADVGGTYNGEWIQAVSRWVTNVYGKTTPLPRTGY